MSDVLARFEEILGERLGVQAGAVTRSQIETALVQRVRETRAGSIAAYVTRIGDAGSAASRAELRALSEMLTVGETYFGRGRDHFEAFAQNVLPDRLRAQASSRRLRILSAGCSTGEEPYTIAMHLAEHDLSAWDVDLVGIDVNPASLATAARGRYGAWSLRELDTTARARHFEDHGREVTLRPELRRMVRFEERNLLDEDPSFWQPGGFDVIFCRNVLIYFTAPAIKDVIARFAGALAPGGYLFLGHSETLRGVTDALRTVNTHETFYYQRAAGALSVPARPVAPPPAPRRRPPAVRPAPAPPPPPVPTGPSLDEALELVRLERFAEAQSLIETMPAERRTARETLVVLASVLHSQGAAAEAARVCRQIRLVDDTNPEARYLEALGHEQSNEIDAAVVRALDAARLDPSFAMPHILVGRTSRRRGDLDGARKAYARALELLLHEQPRRLLLHAGGFSRDALRQLCRAELALCTGVTK